MWASWRSNLRKGVFSLQHVPRHIPTIIHPVALGAKVIAAAGSPEKLEVSRQAGADHGVDYTKEGWQKEVLKITGGKGVDVIYDPVGLIGGTCAVLRLSARMANVGVDSLKCIAWMGRAIVVGFAVGEIEKVSSPYICVCIRACADRLLSGQLALNLVLLKNILLVGIHWGAYTSTSPSMSIQSYIGRV